MLFLITKAPEKFRCLSSLMFRGVYAKLVFVFVSHEWE